VKVLISIPAFNEAPTLGEVLRSLPKRLPGVEAIQVLVVDDGSTDETASVARNAGAIVISHGQNLGVGAAFQTALEQSLRRGIEALVTIDADGQFDSSQIPELIDPIVRGDAEFVTGCRFDGGSRPSGMPRLKYWGNAFLARFIRALSGTALADVSCGFRAYSREALLQLNLFGRFTYTQETILDLSYKRARIVEIPVGVRYFQGRRSRVAGSISRYALNVSKIVIRTARDFWPLRFFGSIGAAVFALGFILDLGLLWHFARSGSFTPYKFVGFAGVTLNVAGILILGLALLADMLDRMRVNQERILYYHKKHAFDDGGEEPN